MERGRPIPQTLPGIERIDKVVGAKPRSRSREIPDHRKCISPDCNAGVGKRTGIPRRPSSCTRGGGSHGSCRHDGRLPSQTIEQLTSGGKKQQGDDQPQESGTDHEPSGSMPSKARHPKTKTDDQKNNPAPGLGEHQQHRDKKRK